jgi:MFS family permease
VGIAVILSVFPARLRSTLAGSFLAGGVFGSVLGMGIGGAVAAQLGWRWSFFAMATFGLAVLALFALVVTEKRVAPERRAAALEPQAANPLSFGKLLPGLFSARSVIFAYLGNGLQLFIVGSLIAWMPSFLNREYGLATGRASAMAAIFVLLSGVGMIVCGTLTDRLCAREPARKFAIAVGLSVATFVFLALGFRLDPGVAQLVMIGLGALLAAGTTGPSTAMVANVTTCRSTRRHSPCSRSRTTCLAWRPDRSSPACSPIASGSRTRSSWFPSSALPPPRRFLFGAAALRARPARLRGAPR